MNLYRILGAASKESKLVNVTHAITRYANTIKLPSFHLPNLRHSGGLVHIGEDSLASLGKRLKLGYVADTMQKLYKIEKLPTQIERKLISEVADLPSYHVGKSKRAAETLEKNFGANITEEVVSKNPRLSKVIDYLKGKSFYSISGGIVLVGATTIFALDAINRHQKYMSGCFRYEMVGGKIIACKVQACSCVDGAPTDSGSSFCQVDKLPDEMKQVSGCKGTSGIVCVNCPIAQLEIDEGNLDSDLTKPTTNDLIYYECKNASFWEAVSDLVGDQVDKVLDKVTQLTDEAVSGVELLLKIVKYGAAIIGVCGVIGAIVWIYFSVMRRDKDEVAIGGTDNVGYSEL